MLPRQLNMISHSDARCRRRPHHRSSSSWLEDTAREVLDAVSLRGVPPSQPSMTVEHSNERFGPGVPVLGVGSLVAARGDCFTAITHHAETPSAVAHRKAKAEARAEPLHHGWGSRRDGGRGDDVAAVAAAMRRSEGGSHAERRGMGPTIGGLATALAGRQPAFGLDGGRRMSCATRWPCIEHVQHGAQHPRASALCRWRLASIQQASAFRPFSWSCARCWWCSPPT